ncbi:MAG: hypothetical protein R3281_10015 [Balneolaceae bacterium]|nr:hypothetical protein [Balneolaceae bacterium]
MEAQTAVDSTRDNWIGRHLVSLDGMSQKGPAHSRDSPPLLELPDEVRVVAFGEATHGDGTVFRIRNRLTDELRDQDTPTILALEALGMFDDPASLMNGTARMWSSSQQVRPQLQDILEMSDSDNFTLSGIDVQHHSTESWFKGVGHALEKLGSPPGDWRMTKQVLQSRFGNPFSPVGS